MALDLVAAVEEDLVADHVANVATIVNERATSAVSARIRLAQRLVTTVAWRDTLAVTVVSHARNAPRIASIATSPDTLLQVVRIGTKRRQAHTIEDVSTRARFLPLPFMLFTISRLQQKNGVLLPVILEYMCVF